MLTFLQGKKTYLLSLLLGLLTVVYWADATLHDDPATPDQVEVRWMTPQTYQSVGLLLGSGAAVSLRSAVGRKPE